MFNWNTRLQIHCIDGNLQEFKNKYLIETGPIGLTDFERMAIGYHKTMGRFFIHFRKTELDSYSIMLHLVSKDSPEGFLLEFSRQIGDQYTVEPTYHKEGFIRKTEKYINGLSAYTNMELLADNKVVDSLIHETYMKNKNGGF